MGTHSITIVRERRIKRNPSEETSILGGPTESQYHYKYFVCIYQHYDGYVKGGMGELLVNVICKLINDSTRQIDGGIIAVKLIDAFFVDGQMPRLKPLISLEDMFNNNDYEFAYIITLNPTGDKSIMLSVYEHSDYDFILTARPEKFLEKYQYYKTQMKEMKKSFAEIDYGDDEVKEEDYISEDQLLMEFL